MQSKPAGRPALQSHEKTWFKGQKFRAEADMPSAPNTTTATYNDAMQDLIERLLIELGEDPTREGLAKTP